MDEATGEKTVSDTVRNIGAAIARGSLSDALSEIGQEGLVTEDSDFSLSSAAQLYRNTKRIISHEVAAYADEVGKTLTALNPAVAFVRWELSARHDTLSSSPDVCDVISELDPYGYGEGLWHKKTVPQIPHPHCECRQSVVLKDPSEWGSSRDIPDEPDVQEAQVRNLMEGIEGERAVTDAHVSSQTETLRNVVSAVHENPRGL